MLEKAAERSLCVIPAAISAGRWVRLPIAHHRIVPRFNEGSARRDLEVHSRYRQWRGRLEKVATRLPSAKFRRWVKAGPNSRGLAKFLGESDWAPSGLATLTLQAGDCLISLDSSWVYDLAGPLQTAGDAGVKRFLFVHDVLPIIQPQWFSGGTTALFAEWLNAVLPHCDGVVTNSRATLAGLANVIQRGQLMANLPQLQTVMHLGADLPAAQHATAMRGSVVKIAALKPLLSVGTIEPRKNIGYLIDLFDRLHAYDRAIAWVIVGGRGWLADAVVTRLTQHPEFNHRLFWLTDASDHELAHLYRSATALVALSLDEGFGLPLVEAANVETPVFATDIPVFREVLGTAGIYVPLAHPDHAVAIIRDWLDGRLQTPLPLPVRRWADCADQLFDWLVK
jgi:glycosyltransferase involved in cell wall biosynthesis